MTRKPTISNDDQEDIRTSREELDRPIVVTDSLLAAYAEMATDHDREDEAELWLGALAVNAPLDEAGL